MQVCVGELVIDGFLQDRINSCLSLSVSKKFQCTISLKILDAAHIDFSLICLLEDIEYRPVPLSRSIPHGHCAGVIHDLDVLKPWPPPLYLNVLALSSFRRVPFYASEQIQWKIFADIFKKLLPLSMGEEILPANLIVVCYSIVGVSVWSKFATGFKQKEACFVEHFMTKCVDSGFSPSATLAHLQIWQAGFVSLFSSKEAMDQPWVSYCQRVCSVSSWWRDNLDNVNDACWKSALDVIQVTWDPGGSTRHRLEDETAKWVQYALSTPWDPGGAIKHRLGGKSNLIGEGLSATWASLGLS